MALVETPGCAGVASWKLQDDDRLFPGIGNHKQVEEFQEN
jgi:hypothetical protein